MLKLNDKVNFKEFFILKEEIKLKRNVNSV